jgi:hypothetical protein
MVGWVALVAMAAAVYWLEAIYGRRRLRRFVAQQGWVLRTASWRPLIPFRQVRFHVEVEQEGQLRRGTARLGGLWTGPVFSSRIEFDWRDR